MLHAVIAPAALFRTSNTSSHFPSNFTFVSGIVGAANFTRLGSTSRSSGFTFDVDGALLALAAALDGATVLAPFAPVCAPTADGRGDDSAVRSGVGEDAHARRGRDRATQVM